MKKVWICRPTNDIEKDLNELEMTGYMIVEVIVLNGDSVSIIAFKMMPITAI